MIIILALILLLLLLSTSWEIFTSVLADGLSLKFEWQQPPHVSRTLLSILAHLNNVVIWTVSTCPLISKSSSPFNNPSVTVPRAAIMIGINVTFMLHSFFQFPSKVKVFVFLFIFFQFYSMVSQDSQVHNFASSLFLLIIIRSGCPAKIWWSVCMSKFHRSLCVSFSRRDAGLCICHLFVWSNFNFLHSSQWITLPC